MSLAELRSTVSDGCLALPRIERSADLADRFAGLMVIVAVSVLYQRLEAAGDHDGALAVLAEFTGSDWPPVQAEKI